MRFWTWKFAVALGLVTGFVVLLFALRDPETGDLPRWWKQMEAGPAAFVFLLLVIYVISHAGGWVLAKFRDRGKPEAEEEAKGRRGRQRAAKGRK